MNLTRISLKNPAYVIVVLILVALFGTISLFKLPIQLTPDIEQPQITVIAGWREAAPEELESVIIEPLENAVRRTPGALDVTTTINRGMGFINLTFDVGTNMQEALLNVLTSLNQAPPLPIDAMEPIVVAGAAGGPGGGLPALASMLVVPTTDVEHLDMIQYQRVIEDIVEPKFSQIPGVAQVNLQSARARELRVTFDPVKAAAYGISLGQLSARLNSAIDMSAGVADVGRRQYTVRFTGKYQLDELAQMRIALHNDRPVYLEDVARVEQTYTDQAGLTLRNGKPAYYITLSRSNSSNTVAVLDQVNQAIKSLNEGALAEHNLAIELSYDASVHIRNALELVKSNLGLGVALALAILWLFFRGWRATLIIAATIPVSLMVAFLALSAFDRTLNVVSLAGLAFAVGLVLDAAIIVQENITRMQRSGMPQDKAVLKGTLQVTGALFASTATSVAIFLPILFMAGIEGQLFSDLALTLSIAVLASLISAITIIPVASKYLLNKQSVADPYAAYWLRLTNLTMRLTNSRIKQWAWVSGLLGAALLVTVSLLPQTDFMPRAPTDGFFYSLVLPPGGNLEFMEQEVASRVKSKMHAYYEGTKSPAIKDYNFYIFGSNAGGFVYAKDPTQVEALMAAAREDIFADIPDTRVFLFRGSMIQINNGGDGRTMNLDLTGANMNELLSVAQQSMATLAEKFPNAAVRPVPLMSLAQPELRISPNDRRIAQSGMSRREVGQYIQAFTSGLFVGEYFDGNDRMNVIVRSEPWQSPEALAQLPLVTPLSGSQTLSELSTIERTVGPSQLRRVNGKRTLTLQITPPADMSLDVAQQKMVEDILPVLQQNKPESVSLFLTGNVQQMNSAITEMTINFVLALVILLLLMSALFKSVKDSIYVLLVMPLAIAGGVLALAALNIFTFQSLDLLTMIGFIILLGLVVNNAILLVDQTREGQRLGLTLKAAVEQAVAIRARPVYLSTLTSLFGMIPLMVMPGVGAEIYRGLATVIVGGMAVSAMFTLVFMPALLQLERDKQTTSKTNHNVTAIERKTREAK